MIEIEVCERPGTDEQGRKMYHACIKGERGCWGAGPSIAAAIGSLLDSHPERFGVKAVNFLPGEMR